MLAICFDSGLVYLIFKAILRKELDKILYRHMEVPPTLNNIKSLNELLRVYFESFDFPGNNLQVVRDWIGIRKISVLCAMLCCIKFNDFEALLIQYHNCCWKCCLASCYSPIMYLSSAGLQHTEANYTADTGHVWIIYEVIKIKSIKIHEDYEHRLYIYTHT